MYAILMVRLTLNKNPSHVSIYTIHTDPVGKSLRKTEPFFYAQGRGLTSIFMWHIQFLHL